MYVEFHDSPSGGRCYVTPEAWVAMEEAGWVRPADEDGWLSTFAHYHLTEAEEAVAAEGSGYAVLLDVIRRWEGATGLNANEAGCECCGPPFCFTLHATNGHCMEAYYIG